ncbi:hypothetical protein EK21DRAFT_97418 [Setomelanomma holmii]|uniref:SMODS and SLOG-associating 2TM effector domain-containing protein n=1 Tax=Setomelanomma holmii TaxID=210430 RepID=A0A9P4HGX5_9PLEO|nr:hypothetical protein EK21DRAFT_97418 [Setomelanomma holmii]
MPSYGEQTPLLRSSQSNAYGSQIERPDVQDIHLQFCALAGVPPANLTPGARTPRVARRSLYGRATHRRNAQNRTYVLTATLSNSLLLTQVVLGAALTGLGASGSSHILITVFGALNTIIAGVVAYLKSRGQPMRARMFRDDLDRVVDEIENSEVMWLGIQSGVHGYDEIAIDDSISVRSEVARLTRLYDKVVKNNTMNDPDMYMNAVTDGANAALRTRPGQPPVPAIVDIPANAPATTAPAAAAPDPSAPTDDPDASPASAPPKSKTPPPTEEPAKPKTGETNESKQPAKSKIDINDDSKEPAEPKGDDDNESTEPKESGEATESNENGKAKASTNGTAF